MTLARLVASGFGSGRFPVAPGTAGSTVAVALGAAMLHWFPPALPLAALAAYLGGLWAVKAAQAEHDPGWVVIDEFAGQWIAMLPLAGAAAGPGPLGLLAAFVLFRLLDIVKPGPIKLAELQGGARGVMDDDVVAGAVAALLLWMARSGWPGVFD